MDERRRPGGVTVVSIDTKGKVATELFARQAGVPQAAKSPANASSDGDDAKVTAKDAKSAREMRELETADERR